MRVVPSPGVHSLYLVSVWLRFASLFGRANLLLALAIIGLGVILVRGWP